MVGPENMTELLLAAIGALTTGLLALWRRTERGLDMCEKDRRALWDHIIQIQQFACSTEKCGERTMMKPPSLIQVNGYKKRPSHDQ